MAREGAARLWIGPGHGFKPAQMAEFNPLLRLKLYYSRLQIQGVLYLRSSDAITYFFFLGQVLPGPRATRPGQISAGVDNVFDVRWQACDLFACIGPYLVQLNTNDLNYIQPRLLFLHVYCGNLPL